MNEIERVKIVYKKRKKLRVKENMHFSYNVKCEREFVYFKVLKRKFNRFDNIKIMEVGAGNGGNLIAFKRFGFSLENIYANELLDDRVEELIKNLPNSNIFPGNALDLEFENYFDIVFQSTVFTSILDFDFKQKLANKMFKMAKDGGLILWYDFKYNNPNNQDVKGVSKSEIRNLFSNAKKIIFYNATLAPPIGRRVGRLYNYFNILPILRTHIIAVIYK